jgi:hypothetical protein
MLKVRSKVMPSKPLSHSPGFSAHGVNDIASAKAARACFDEFWSTRDEALLKRIFDAEPPPAPAANGLWPNRRLGAPDGEPI